MAHGIQDMTDAVDAAEQRNQQDEVATQPATTPRSIDPEAREWLVNLPKPPPSLEHNLKKSTGGNIQPPGTSKITMLEQ